jgi:hypothetical protein
MTTHGLKITIDDDDIDDEERLVKKAEELVSKFMSIKYGFLTAA